MSRPFVIGGLFLVLSILVFLELIAGSGGLIGPRDILHAPWRPETLAQALIETSRLPRLVVAIATGAALGLAGAVMQTLLRNPLAAPDILGVSSGALLCLAVNTLLLQGVLPPLGATVLGGAAGGALSLVIGGGPNAGPTRLALAGVAVSLLISGLSTLIILLADDRASGIILWSAGLLDQTGWDKVGVALPAMGIAALTALACAGALDIHALGAEVARGLGLSRIPAALALAAAIVCVGGSVVIAGPIGFVGLAVPNLLRHLGLRRHALLLPFSALAGAVMVLFADVIAQALGRNGTSLPTGTMIGLLGAPIVVLILRRGAELRAEGLAAIRGMRPRPGVLAALLLAAIAMAGTAGLILGDGTVRNWAMLGPAFEARGPRILTGLAAGALLALAGTIVQAQLRNALAAPETLGLSQAAALAALTAILAGASPGSVSVLLSALIGTAICLLAIRGLARTSSGSRLPLVGIAISASLAALSLLLVITMQMQAAEALHWLSGTLHGRGWSDFRMLAPWLLLLPCAAALARSLDLLQFDENLLADLGGRPGRLHLLAGAIVVCAVAAAISAVGAIGFVGILGPNAARLLVGARHRRSIWVAAGLGAVMVSAADTVGRAAMPPYDLPAGVITTLIGAPFFAALLVAGARARRD